MSPELVSILAEIPVLVLFFLFVTNLRKQETEERRQRDEAWMKAISDMEDSRHESSSHLATAMASLGNEIKVSMKGFQEEILRLRKQQARLTVAVTLHDATVKGVNPDAMGSPEDMYRKILET